MVATSAAKRGTAALWGVVAALLVALVAAVAVKVGAAQRDDREAVLAAACDLTSGPCTATLPGGAGVELDLGPRPIPLAAPLAVHARLRGADPAAAELRVISTTMDMGTTAISLARSAAGRLDGEGALPVCVTGTMTWVASLYLDRDPHPAARFKFFTRTP